VDAALASARDELAAADGALAATDAKVSELEQVASRLSERVVARERELRELRDELVEMRARSDEGARALATLARQLEEIRAQARGQATRIRMRALRDAAELSERIGGLARRPGEAGGRMIEALEEAARRLGDGREVDWDADERSEEPARGTAIASANGRPEDAPAAEELFQGLVHVDVGPLSDFSQLVLFEDAARSIGATSEISIKRFSRGRATMAVQLREPVALLRELEERCDLEFKVRDQRHGRVILDVDQDE
jgi:hypothetical protein